MLRYFLTLCIRVESDEQNRTEQNRTEQNRTEQNRTEQNRTEQNRTEQNRINVARCFFHFLCFFTLVLTGCKWDDALHKEFVNDDGSVAPKCPGLAYIATAEGKCERGKCEDFKLSFKHDNCPKSHVCRIDGGNTAFCIQSIRCPRNMTSCLDNDLGILKCIDPQTDPKFCGAALGECNDAAKTDNYMGIACSGTSVCQDGLCIDCGENACIRQNECQESGAALCGSDCRPCLIIAAAEISCNDGVCKADRCLQGYHESEPDETGEVICEENSDTACSSVDLNCTELPDGGTGYCNVQTGECVVTGCKASYSIADGKCKPSDESTCGNGNPAQNCTKLNGWVSGTCTNDTCVALECKEDYCLSEGTCVAGAFNVKSCGIDGNTCNACDNGKMCDNGQCVDLTCSEVPAGVCPSTCTSSEEGCSCENTLSRCGSNCTDCTKINHVKAAECTSDGTCKITECEVGYHVTADAKSCVIDTLTSCGSYGADCTNVKFDFASAVVCRDGKCTIAKCVSGYSVRGNMCVRDTNECCGDAPCKNCTTHFFDIDKNAKPGKCNNGMCLHDGCVPGFFYNITEDKCVNQNSSCGGVNCTAKGEVCNEDNQCVCGKNPTCTNGTTCQDGACKCPENEIFCSSLCVNPQKSLTYCGARGNCTGNNAGDECTAGQFCDEGVCVKTPVTCQSDEVVCDGKCIDPASDPEYCGAALNGTCSSSASNSDDYQGKTCGTGEKCTNGQCACVPGFIRCKGTCIDPQTSEAYCGARGRCSDGGKLNPDFQGENCGKDASCEGGLCLCSGATTTCNLGEICVNGKCQCGTSVCDDGKFCTSGGECWCSSPSIGNCECRTGWIICNGKCIDPKTSYTNCGARGECNDPNVQNDNFRGVDCGAGAHCVDWLCRCSNLQAVSPCNLGEKCAGDQLCQCGDTPGACSVGEFCASNGACQPKTTP